MSALTDAELAALRGLGQGQVPAAVQQIVDARETAHAATVNATAEWLAATGYPVEFAFTDDLPLPPKPLWDALVDHVHADTDGKWHGGELDRDGVHYWLLDELGHDDYPEEAS